MATTTTKPAAEQAELEGGQEDRARHGDAASPPSRSRESKPVADTLHGKIAEVQAEIGVMPPDRHVDVKNREGTATQYSYDYLSESALMSAVRSKLALRGVAVYVACTAQRREGNLTFVEMAMTFADGATGATFTVTGQGQGSDNSDKGVYKAQTGATRYMLWKTFLVPTEGDDPNQPHQTDAARNDAPVTIVEVINRLEVFVEDPRPWIKEAIEGFYSKPDAPVKLGNFNELQPRVRLNSLSRLQLAVLDLEDDAKAYEKLEPDAQQSKVRAVFGRAFGGLAVKGPEPFAPAIPF